MSRTLVDLLVRDIARTDAVGPDWRTATEDAVLRQDMEWTQMEQAGISVVRLPRRGLRSRGGRVGVIEVL